MHHKLPAIQGTRDSSSTTAAAAVATIETDRSAPPIGRKDCSAPVRGGLVSCFGPCAWYPPRYRVTGYAGQTRVLCALYSGPKVG